MSYSVVEAAALTVIKLHADYDDDNCKAGDSSPIKNGLPRVCRLLYGGGKREELTLTIMRHTWTINVDIYVPYRGKLDTLEAQLATERQTIIDQLAQYPRLNNCAGVISAEVLNGDKPEPLAPKKSAYRGQRLYLEVKESVKPARVG
jgi:hypothetical protein